jgi:hypothetical protein
MVSVNDGRYGPELERYVSLSLYNSKTL